MATAVFNCARVRLGQTCSVKIVGERGDVIQAAHDHLVKTHGFTEEDNLKTNVTQAVDEHESKSYGIWGN